MVYQLRKTAQGLMLYGSELNRHVWNFNMGKEENEVLNEHYSESFQPICPIHKEHEEAFMCYALKLKYNEIYTADAVAKLIEGIEIPSERVQIRCDFCDNIVRHCSKFPECKTYFAFLLPKKKEEEIIKTYTESDLRAAFGKGYARGYQQRDCEENYNPITGFEPKNKEATFEEFFKSLK
jgi:hypothetical protein